MNKLFWDKQSESYGYGSFYNDEEYLKIFSEYQDAFSLWGPFFHYSNKMGGQIICEYK